MSRTAWCDVGAHMRPLRRWVSTEVTRQVPAPASWMEKVLDYRAGSANPEEAGRMAALLTRVLSACTTARSTRSMEAARTAARLGERAYSAAAGCATGGP